MRLKFRQLTVVVNDRASHVSLVSDLVVRMLSVSVAQSGRILFDWASRSLGILLKDQGSKIFHRMGRVFVSASGNTGLARGSRCHVAHGGADGL
jgi:hypothetical protein